MPGGRKFRLSTRKNYERKKYSKKVVSQLMVHIPRTIYDSLGGHDSIPEIDEPLIISIPHTVYFDANVANPALLFERIRKLKLMTSSWSFEMELDELIISRLCSYGRVIITIDINCNWIIKVNEIRIFLPKVALLNICDTKINSIRVLKKLMINIEDSRLCVDNSEEKLFHIRDVRKGKFMDYSGKRDFSHCT